MARTHPFKPFRYHLTEGLTAGDVLTQPYDKISPAMRETYLSRSPYNLVRIILGKPEEGDDDTNNVYTRGAALFGEWTGSGILRQDPEAAYYAYFQDFADPDTGEALTRKGFIGLGDVVPYEDGVVHRHEKTLAGPKKDRLEVLRHSQAHFGQIFMLYPDPEGAIDMVLDRASAAAPLTDVTDDYGCRHRLWAITDPAEVTAIQGGMESRKLIIADGHHRYETALNYSRESGMQDAGRVMMTFVNMYSPGLRILATHRVVKNVGGFDWGTLAARLSALGAVRSISAEELPAWLGESSPESIRVAVALANGGNLALEAARAEGALDVPFLHEAILGGILGIGEEAVRHEQNLTYVRGAKAAIEEVRQGRAQAAFLLQPTTVDQVGTVSLGGGVMPQKSTDFYPKLLTGMAIYRLER